MHQKDPIAEEDVITGMSADEARNILTKAAEQIGDDIPAHWIMLLQAMRRRLDHAERVKGRRKPPRCDFAVVHNELAIPNRPCKGRKVKCNHPENKISETYEAMCRPLKCKYFYGDER